MEMLKIHVSNLIAMEKKIHVAVTIVVMAFGLILATVGSAQSGHAQNATGSASNAMKSAGGAMNKTAGNMSSAGKALVAKSAGGANKTAGNMSSAAGGAAGSNKTSGGNSSSSNPLAKVPIIGKLFGK
jgi:hypothetical protein